MKHLIFYDSVCPLCNRAIRFLIDADQKNIFSFAPLGGETALRELADVSIKYPNLDTLILLQNYGTEHEQLLVEGKAVLRILWILGGGYAWLGIFSFLPTFLADGIYRLVARYRYRLFSNPSPIEKKEGRFLP